MAACLIGACSAPQTSKSRAPEPQPNVLVILVDCLRADRVGGSENLTPTLDRLAAEGIRFDNAFSPASWTKPSIASLFTALYPGQHGLRRVAFDDGQQLSTDALPAQAETVAEHFQRGGYATGAIINQVHLHAKFGFDQGFEHFEALRGRHAGSLNQRLLDWLRADRDGRPFFAYLHYLDVHWPYTSGAAAKHLSQWQTGPPPRKGNRAHDWIESFEPEARPDVARKLAGLYDLEVRFIDTRIGRLLEELNALDAYDDTIIVVTSDHGEGFYEHQQLQHGYAPFEEVIHVPLIVRLPGEDPAGSVISQPVSLVDVFPTLAQLAGLPPPEVIAGRSLVPLWQSGRWRSRLLFAEGAATIAVRSEQHKLITSAESSEYYDLRADPREQRPIDRQRCGEACDELDQALTAYQNSNGKVPADEAVTLTGEDIEDLKDLGYL